MEEGKTVNKHDVFNIDPIELQTFIGCYVNMNLLNEVNLSGIVYTIDPVSQRESVSMKIILKHSIVSMEVIPDTPLHLKNLNLNDIFSNKDNKQNNTSDIVAIKERVKLWLLQNMIEVEENGDLLKLGSLEIHPPYGDNDCICSNSIVLDRVQQLLRNMSNETAG